MNIILYACKIYLETHIFIPVAYLNVKFIHFRVLLQLPVRTRRITKHWIAGMALHSVGIVFRYCRLNSVGTHT